MAFVAANERQDGYTHVLLIATGSVASIKVPLIVKELLRVCILILSAL
jgi:phosphopantothenoylcysteine decarboxylase